MNSPDENPKLPMWIFFATDAVLLAAAWLIAHQSPPPLSPQAVFAVLALIFGGALVTLVPLIARFERQKNELLDERQRALEALARTVAASAEQISIAANGLHEIAELTHKNLRHAEQLPHKLQEKIAEFQAQVANVSDGEKEELEKELVALRSSESERLESISAKIAKSAADWTKLEAATHQHLLAANEAVAKLSATTAGAAQAIEAARAAALAELDGRKTKATAPVVTPPAGGATSQPAIGAVSIEATPVPGASRQEAQAIADAPPMAEPEKEPTVQNATVTSEVSVTPKRPRKPRRSVDEIVAAATTEVEVSPLHAPGSPNEPEQPMENPEPVPLPAEKISEVAPVTPDTAEPFVTTTAVPTTKTESSAAPAASEVEAPKPTRKRAPKKAPPETEPSLSLGIDEPVSPADGESIGVVERVRTSDGATRLLVTAYIGIGNRLFIRGEGPGLSWEKGVPLQFVSIGKWRWETNDAGEAVKYKLYKNDDVECAALGAQILDSGHQQEVAATF